MTENKAIYNKLTTNVKKKAYIAMSIWILYVTEIQVTYVMV